jgi:hypothetical protein
MAKITEDGLQAGAAAIIDKCVLLGEERKMQASHSRALCGRLHHLNSPEEQGALEELARVYRQVVGRFVADGFLSVFPGLAGVCVCVCVCVCV